MGKTYTWDIYSITHLYSSEANKTYKKFLV